MDTKSDADLSTEVLIDCLQQPTAYPHDTAAGIEVHETHISIVFLAGDFAYKIKKPIKTEFLDYSTLELRRHYCHEELRLDSRYARDMYLDVVPIGWESGRLRIESDSDPIEYAVKMRRFPKGALLSDQLASGEITTKDVHQLADTVASFHQQAARCVPEFAAQWPDYFTQNFDQILAALRSKADDKTGATLKLLGKWASQCFAEQSAMFSRRVKDGFIRECHGDLHLQNVVLLGERLIPFDGVEFSERLRWIDVLCDAAFLEMDFAFHGHLELSRTFMNAYLERSGDYRSLNILPPFLVYRSLIRALVASIRSGQSHLASSERESATRDARQHIDLAFRFTIKKTRCLWITHGVSGSGKTTLSEAIVQRHEAFRLRSDIERKRLIGLLPTERPSAELQAEMYSMEANEQTYSRLENLARAVLDSGYSVIIDATFLKRSERDRFFELAQQQCVRFAILDCNADELTFRQRLADRMAKNYDASDADVHVLEKQLVSNEPLAASELGYVVQVPDIAAMAKGI